MPREETVIFGLNPRDSVGVVNRLYQKGLWDWGGMIYDEDADILITTTAHAKEVVMAVLEEMDLAPTSAVTFKKRGKVDRKIEWKGLLEELSRPDGIESLIRAGRVPRIQEALVGTVVTGMEKCYLFSIPPAALGPDSWIAQESGGPVFFAGPGDEGTPCPSVLVNKKEGDVLIERSLAEQERILAEWEKERWEALPWWKKLIERVSNVRFRE